MPKKREVEGGYQRAQIRAQVERWQETTGLEVRLVRDPTDRWIVTNLDERACYLPGWWMPLLPTTKTYVVAGAAPTLRGAWAAFLANFATLRLLGEV